MSVKNYVFVLPDLTEYFKDLDISDRIIGTLQFQHEAQNVLYEAKYSTPRSSPRKICVRIYRLDIVKGQIKRTHVADRDVAMPLAPLTELEFKTELHSVLDELPAEFHNFVRSTSWDEGHSSGYENVISCAKELVAGLRPCVEAFAKRTGVKL